MAWTAPKTFTSAAATSAEMNTHLRDNLLALTSWTAYTPTIGGTGWALGNGTVSGAYVSAGSVVDFRIAFTLGSTSTAGAGQLTFTLPVACAAGLYFMPVMLYDSGSTTRYHGLAMGTTSSSTLNFYCHSATGSGHLAAVTTSAPFTWATGDMVNVSGRYQS